MTGLVLLLLSLVAHADELRVAVASNFVPTARLLLQDFAAASGHDTRIVSGSTGKLYAQIVHRAPFDVFLAADAARPRLLEDSGKAIAGSRFTYAFGRLAIYSRDPALGGDACANWPDYLRHRKLAIANPELAPYGVAARQYLVSIGRWDALQPNLVIAENIAQAMQFTVNGGALLGLVAVAQLQSASVPDATCMAIVPQRDYEPVEQQAVQLARSAGNTAAIELMRYLKSERAAAIVERAGYGIAKPDS